MTARGRRRGGTFPRVTHGWNRLERFPPSVRRLGRRGEWIDRDLRQSPAPYFFFPSFSHQSRTVAVHFARFPKKSFE